VFFAEHQEARIVKSGMSWLKDRRKQVCKDMQDALNAGIPYKYLTSD